jgi:hypothetical protein
MSACAYHLFGWFYVCHPRDLLWLIEHWGGAFAPWPR